VADVYDALISDRPYRAGWSLSDVITFVNSKAGFDFDPEVVQAFRSLNLNEPAKTTFTLQRPFGPAATPSETIFQIGRGNLIP